MNQTIDNPFKKIFYFILVPGALAWFMATIALSLFGYVDNNSEEVAKKLEEDFIFSPVDILNHNDQHSYQLHLYSYQETQEVTRYGISQSHELGAGDWVKPRKLIEKEELLNGFFLLKDTNILAIGGYNPGIATSVVVEVKDKTANETWKREIKLPDLEYFLITKELPHEYAGRDVVITYLDSKRKDVTRQLKKKNQINE